MLKPFYFFVVVWGDRFLGYLTDLCLPSLLAPNNIPALQPQRNNKIIFCMTLPEWQKLQQHQIFAELIKYITPVFKEIPYPTADTLSCTHMGIGHKIATELCYQDKAYGVALTPDLIVSDGTFATVEQQAQQNTVQLLLCPAVRFAEEQIIAGLHAEKIIDSKLPTPQLQLIASGRQLVKIGSQAFHSQTKAYNFETDYFAANSPSVYWRHQADGGILLYCLSWAPLLMDYGIVTQHHTETLDHWTMDGDYVYQNFGHAEHIYVSTDSDEIMLISWAPEDYNPVACKASWYRKHLSFMRNTINSLLVRAALCNPIFDPLKIKLFNNPVRWHIKDLDSSWQQLEGTAQQLIIKNNNNWDGRLFYYFQKIIHKCYNYVTVSIRALCGDSVARNIIKSKVRRVFSFAGQQQKEDAKCL